MPRDPDVHLAEPPRLTGRPLRAAPNLASTGRGETCPQRFDELGDKRAVTFEFLRRCEMRACGTECPHDNRAVRHSYCDGARFGDQAKADLPTTGQLDINLCQQLRVEQRAMLDAMAAVDPEPNAQSVEAVLGAWVP